MPNHIKQAQPSPPLSHYTKFSPKTPTSHTHSHTHTHNQPNAQPKQDQTSLTSQIQLSLGARRKNFVTHSPLHTQNPNPKPHPILKSAKSQSSAISTHTTSHTLPHYRHTPKHYQSLSSPNTQSIEPGRTSNELRCPLSPLLFLLTSCSSAPILLGSLPSVLFPSFSIYTTVLHLAALFSPFIPS